MAKKKEDKIDIYTISIYNVETEEFVTDSNSFKHYYSEDEALQAVKEVHNNYNEVYDVYINYGEYETKSGDILGEQFPVLIDREFRNGGELIEKINKKKQFQVFDYMKNQQIHVDNLTKILGRKPNYPHEKVGNLELKKCFLRPYYQLVN